MYRLEEGRVGRACHKFAIIISIHTFTHTYTPSHPHTHPHIQVRKLEFLLADALQQECDCVVTFGGLQSNHARTTALAARQLGLSTHFLALCSTETVREGMEGGRKGGRVGGREREEAMERREGLFPDRNTKSLHKCSLQHTLQLPSEVHPCGNLLLGLLAGTRVLLVQPHTDISLEGHVKLIHTKMEQYTEKLR